MLNPQRDFIPAETDDLETMTANEPTAESDSATSDDDAGLDDALLDEVNPASYGDDDEGDPGAPRREINMTDLASGPYAGDLSSPEDSDLNSPGEVDIEQLDDNALADTDIPKDALLDPLEE